MFESYFSFSLVDTRAFFFFFCLDRGFKRKSLSSEIIGCKIKIFSRNK